MGRLDDIQTALKPLQKSEKVETHFYDHFLDKLNHLNDEPARPVSKRPQRFLISYFSESMEGRWGRKILTQSLLNSSICAIKVWDQYLS